MKAGDPLIRFDYNKIRRPAIRRLCACSDREGEAKNIRYLTEGDSRAAYRDA